MWGVPDEAFIRGRVPMTKAEIRGIIMRKLRLREESILVDVGAGTGSVTIEAAMHVSQGSVYAIEYKEEAVELIKKNIEKFQLENIQIMTGRAKEQLMEIQTFDRMFIGGSEGELQWMIRYAAENLPSKGRIVMTAVTLETAYEGLQFLKQNEFTEIETISVSIAKGRVVGNRTLMEAENPITVISAERGEQHER